MDDLTELRAALLVEGKLDVLTEQAEYGVACDPDELRRIVDDVEQRGKMSSLLHGMTCAAVYHERSAALFQAGKARSVPADNRGALA